MSSTKNKSGFVYILIKDLEIIYIGATINPEQRLKCHKRKKYNYYVVLPENRLYKDLESYMILLFKPKLNKQFNVPKNELVGLDRDYLKPFIKK